MPQPSSKRSRATRAQADVLGVGSPPTVSRTSAADTCRHPARCRVHIIASRRAAADAAQRMAEMTETVAATPTTWHTLSPEVAARQLEVDPERGLTSAEAAERLARYGPN